MQSLLLAFSFGVAFNENHEKWGEKDDDGRQIAIAVGGQNSKQPSTLEPLRVRALPIFTCTVVGWVQLDISLGRTYVNREQLRGGGLDTKYDL